MKHFRYLTNYRQQQEIIPPNKNETQEMNEKNMESKKQAYFEVEHTTINTQASYSDYSHFLSILVSLIFGSEVK